jgi:hypothetical protein
MATQAGSFLATRRSRLMLLLVCFSSIATARTSALLAAHTPRVHALTAGFHQALLACAIFLVAAAGIALRATNTHGEPAARPDQLPPKPTAHGPTGADRPGPAHPTTHTPGDTATMTAATTPQPGPARP